jgi:hypothetical protein
VIHLSKFLNHTLATHNQVDSFFENISHNDGKGAFTLTLFEMTITDCPGFHVPHCTMPATKFWPSLSVLIMNVIFWMVNFKTQNYFVISTTQNVYRRLSMYDCSKFVHSCRIFGISELQTCFKQFKLIVKLTRFESGVTIPKGLFTLYLNVKQVTDKIFWPP